MKVDLKKLVIVCSQSLPSYVFQQYPLLTYCTPAAWLLVKERKKSAYLKSSFNQLLQKEGEKKKKKKQCQRIIL